MGGNRFFQYAPDDLVEWLIAAGQAETENYFAVGDRAISFYQLCAVANRPITYEEIWTGFAELRGRSPRTIRDWTQIAAFYPPEIRRKYSPPLFFAHFRAAKTFGNRWQEYLEFAVQTPDKNGGRPWSVARLESHFSGWRDEMQRRQMEEASRRNGDLEPEYIEFDSEIIVDPEPQIGPPEFPDDMVAAGAEMIAAAELRRRVDLALDFLEKAVRRLDGLDDRRRILQRIEQILDDMGIPEIGA